jgi:hypothetical protein
MKLEHCIQKRAAGSGCKARVCVPLGTSVGVAYSCSPGHVEGEKRVTHILCALMRAIMQQLLNAPEDERESIESALPQLIAFMQAGGAPEQANKMFRELDAERRRAQMQLVRKPDEADAS